MIKFADNTNIYSIRELWDIAFGEDKAFNDYFFKNIFKAENTLILTENNNLISMAQMIPYNIKNLGEVTYIYGAATNPLYRGKRYMKTLLEESFELDKKLGRKASILIPAEKSLFDYYGRLGYKTGFYIDNKNYVNTNEYNYDFKEADNISDMLKIYKGDILRDSNYFKTQIDMFKSLGGNVFALYDGDISAYAFVWNNDELQIQEIMYTHEKYIQIIANHIMKYYNKDNIKISTGNNLPFGMIKYHYNNTNYNMYMNLMFN